jgi:putative ABC transport system substrate-binding protein
MLKFPEWEASAGSQGVGLRQEMALTRRTFLAHTGAVLAVPLAAGAQQAGKVYRVGVLGNENNPPWEGFRRGLRELGYVDGQNVTIEWRWSEGKPDRFPGLAIEVVTLRPDVIVASGTQAIRAAKRATSAIPIIMTTSSYPDKIGLVDSLSHPGGNVTGLSNVGPELSGKKLELLKEIAPTASRVAVLFNASSEVEPLVVQELSAVAPAIGFEIESVDVRSPDDFSAAFGRLSPSRLHALLALGNPINFRARQLIANFALKNRLPSIYDERLFVEAGGLLSYAPSFADSFRRAATYVDKILKGQKPADLPVEQPTKFELIINLKTAKALGLTIPPSLLLRADQVIE